MATTDQDRELKQRHRKMWASGDYPAMAPVVAPLSVHLVQACGIQRGTKVLDVGCGTGSSAIPAAELGAEVVASDLTPELLDVGRRHAEQRGVEVTWVEADAEALPFGDGEFDVTLSAIGAMFAPSHEAVAREMLRVTRPGGVIGMANWTPAGFIGDMFKVMKPFAPPPPPGAQPPPTWGDEDHVRDLIGRGCSDLRLERHELEVTEFDTPQALLDFFKPQYGPTIAIYNHIGDDAARAAELDRALLDLYERRNLGGDGPAYYRWEYLLAVGHRSG